MLRKTRQGRNQDPRICCFSSVSEAGILQLSARVHANSLQSCPSLCNPVDRSPPGSSVHRILQARILEWAALLQGIFPTQGWKPTSLKSPALAGKFFTTVQLRAMDVWGQTTLCCGAGL